ncbi:MAG: bacillithiol system redox-active protein YtxJ [Thermoanaerobaculia bacterium]
MSDLSPLSSPSELDPLIRASHRRDLWLFKHSTRCGASAHALLELEEFLRDRGAELDATVRLIEVPRQRELSDAVAERAGVRHQSPQLLVFRNGEVVWHASHWAIERDRLERALAGLQQAVSAGAGS